MEVAEAKVAAQEEGSNWQPGVSLVHGQSGTVLGNVMRDAMKAQMALSVFKVRFSHHDHLLELNAAGQNAFSAGPRCVRSSGNVYTLGCVYYRLGPTEAVIKGT